MGLAGVLVFLLAAGTAWAQDQPPKAPAKDTSVKWEAGLDIRYDDNILFLSDASIRRFESGLYPGRFRIDSVDDTVASLSAGASFPGETEFGLGARYNHYFRNTIRSYGQFHAFLLSRDGEDDSRRFTYRWVHGVYAGELSNPDTGAFETTHYDVHSIEGRFAHRYSPVVTNVPHAALRLRPYNSDLNDPRTVGGLEVGTDLRLDPERWVQLDAEVGFEFMHSFDLSLGGGNGGNDYDPSFYRLYLEVGGVLRPLERDLDLSLHYRLGVKRFTGSDALHSGRTDTSHRIRARVEYHFTKSTSVHFTYEHDILRADVPVLPNIEDEELGFGRNAYTLGVDLKF